MRDHLPLLPLLFFYSLSALPRMLLLLVIFSVTTFAADLIILKNGQRISGTIDPNADVGPDQIAINTGNGVLRLPRSAVDIQDLSFDARKARLNKDDHAAYVALALWCRTKGMTNEALELLDHAVNQKQVTLATRALHVRLVDEVRGPEKALELYRRYRQDGGDDATTLARLDLLEKVIREYETQSSAVTTTTPTTSTAPKLVPTAQGGLESKGWANEALQWSNPVKPQVISVATEAGNIPALQIDFSGGDKDKATIKRSARLTIGQDSVLAFLAKNSGEKPVSIAIAVKTGSKYLFHESPQQVIKTSDSFQKIKFDLKSANFKSAASNWENNTPVADLNDVKEIQILIYNGRQDGSLIISGMGFPTTPDL
jgi:hypothetical protein